METWRDGWGWRGHTFTTSVWVWEDRWTPVDVDEGGLNEPLLITVMDGVLRLRSRRCYLFYTGLKKGLGEMGRAPQSIHQVRKRRKNKTEKRYQCLNISCLWWVLLLTWGFPPTAFQHSNMKHMVEMGVGKRTRVIIGTVGVIESWGSAVCVTGISSRFCGFIWIIKKSLQNNFNSSSHTWTFYCCTNSQSEPAKRTHRVFNLPAAPAACMPGIVAPRQACLHI